MPLTRSAGNLVNFGISVSDFHNNNITRLNAIPNSLLASSTHDTKFSEDVRARLSVLSEIPEIWQKKINKLTKINRSRKTKIDEKFFPDKNTEYLFYQVLLGIWTNEKPNGTEIKKLSERLENYMIKAVREAKKHTSWININFQYENALINFIKKILNSPENHLFWKEFLPFQEEIALRGYINSVSQAVLKYTSPGVPDIYQGTELWKYNLVDPDNRQPINFNKYQNIFHEIKYILKNKILDNSCFLP